MYRPAQQTLDAGVVGQFQKTAHDLQQMMAHSAGVFRLAEPVSEHQGRFIATDERHQRGRIEKFFLHEITKIIGDPVLIAGNNRRMSGDKRQRDTAKQSHHREPVGQRPDHRRFGDGFECADPRRRR